MPYNRTTHQPHTHDEISSVASLAAEMGSKVLDSEQVTIETKVSTADFIEITEKMESTLEEVGKEIQIRENGLAEMLTEIFDRHEQTLNGNRGTAFMLIPGIDINN